MLGTANWYCAPCSRFMPNELLRCDNCDRTRGSARQHLALVEAANYFRVVRERKRPRYRTTLEVPAHGTPPRSPSQPAGRPTGQDLPSKPVRPRLDAVTLPEVPLTVCGMMPYAPERHHGAPRTGS